jgi:hypothetical protein
MISFKRTLRGSEALRSLFCLAGNAVHTRFDTLNVKLLPSRDAVFSTELGRQNNPASGRYRGVHCYNLTFYPTRVNFARDQIGLKQGKPVNALSQPKASVVLSK